MRAKAATRPNQGGTTVCRDRAAWQVPELFVPEVRTGFRKLR